MTGQMKLVGRPPIFKQRVHKATGLTMDQYEWTKEVSAQTGLSQMALLRTSVSLLMKREKIPIAELAKEEMKDVLERIRASKNGS